VQANFRSCFRGNLCYEKGGLPPLNAFPLCCGRCCGCGLPDSRWRNSIEASGVEDTAIFSASIVLFAVGLDVLFYQIDNGKMRSIKENCSLSSHSEPIFIKKWVELENIFYALKHPNESDTLVIREIVLKPLLSKKTSFFFVETESDFCQSPSTAQVSQNGTIVAVNTYNSGQFRPIYPSTIWQHC